MKHKTHMNRFTALNKTVALSLAAAGLVSASPAFAAALTNASYVSINDNNEPVRGNYDSKGATGRYGVVQLLMQLPLSVAKLPQKATAALQ